MDAHGAGDDDARRALLTMGPILLQVQCGTCNKFINVHAVHIRTLMERKSYTCPNCNSLQSIDIDQANETALSIQAEQHMNVIRATQAQGTLPPEVVALLQQQRGLQPKQQARTGAAASGPPGPSSGRSRNLAAAGAAPMVDEAIDLLHLEEINDAGRDEAEQRETFMDYKPWKILFGSRHPDPVVETSSLGTVEPPDVTYSLAAHDELLKCLSNLQLEAIIYACQRHMQTLPNGACGGFFIGDGAGVGKGRTIAGLMLENWRQGRKKHLWVSVGSDLKVDAERDLNDVGAGPSMEGGIPLHALNKLPYGKLAGNKIGVREGIVFLTYSSLVSSSERGMSRYKQLLEWCGKDFDGLIVFDESHKAKNLVAEAGSKPTQVGLRVKDIQDALPQARVVYCSATGASEPRNMGYMVRLGLWGEGNPAFRDFARFLEAIQGKGGGAAAAANTMAALELVAMDMKAQGMYVCRTLSFAGAEFKTDEFNLEEPVRSQYYKATQMWNRLFREFLYAEEKASDADKNFALIGKSSSRKERGGGALGYASDGCEERKESAAAVSGATAAGTTTGGGNRRGGFVGGSMVWRSFWAGHQRFFRHMCMAAKVPAVKRIADKALDDGKCVVIGLQSTGEARTAGVMASKGEELDDFVSGPKELLLNLVENYYPLPPDPWAEDWDADTESEDEDEDFENLRITEAAACGALGGRDASKRSKSNVRYKEYASDEEIGISGDESTSSSSRESSSSSSDESDGEQEGEKKGKKDDGGVEGGGDVRAGSASDSAKSAPSGSVVKESDADKSDGDSENSGVNSDPSFDAEGERRRGRRRLLTEEEEKIREMERDERAMRLEHAEKAFVEAKGRKDILINDIEQLELPANPLDDLIDRLGGPDDVAEMTGRKGRLVRDNTTGKVRFESRNASLVTQGSGVTLEMINVHERQLFMDGSKRVAIISEAASAGISLHSDRRAKNKQRRVHLTLELPWSADKAIQQFGRSHRANQVHGPEYILMFTPLGGEKRFAAAVARRLESLGALTQGDRKAGPSLSKFNYESIWGQRALKEMYAVLLEEKPAPPAVVPLPCRFGPNGEAPAQPLPRFLAQSRARLLNIGLLKHTRGAGISLTINKYLDSPDGAPRGIGTIDDRERNDVPRFLNRLLGLDPQAQADIFDYYQETLDEMMERAKREDTLDEGIVNLTARTITVEGEPRTLYTDATTGARAVLYSIKLDRGLPWEDAKTLLEDRLKDEAAAAEGNGTPGQKEAAAAPAAEGEPTTDGIAVTKEKESEGGIKRPREDQDEEGLKGHIQKVEDVDAVSEQPEKKLKIEKASENGKIEQDVKEDADAPESAPAQETAAAPEEDVIDLVSEDDHNGEEIDEGEQEDGKKPKPSQGAPGKEEEPLVFGSGFYKARHQVLRGRVHVLLALRVEGSSPPMFFVHRPVTGRAQKPWSLKDLQSKYVPLAVDAAAPLWQAAYTAAGEPSKDGKPGLRFRSVHLLCGSVMRCWGAVHRALIRHVKSGERRIRVKGITTGTSKDGKPQRLVGMEIPEVAVEEVVKELTTYGVPGGLAHADGPGPGPAVE